MGHPTFAKPVLYCTQQGCGHFLVIDRLEQTPEADLVVVDLIVIAIDDRGDPTNDPAISFG
jgi:hypothetical protein